MKISVLTATYNRANFLSKLYESLKNNISDNYEIEWLIMDDGSSDNTEEVCGHFSNIKGLIVKYFKQKNQGKMTAINNLSQYVTGELWIECDSDDYFVENCFSVLYNNYVKYKEKEDIYAFCYLKYDQNFNNMGQEFKKFKNNMFNLYFKDGENGEKALVFFSKIRKKYKYELENNERFVTEARMFHKMDLNYSILCFNEYIMICEYQDEGYTKNINKQFILNPYGYYKYFYEILNDMDTNKVLFKQRLYVIKHFILFSYLTHQKCKIHKRGFINKFYLFLLFVPGYLKSYFYVQKIQDKL